MAPHDLISRGALKARQTGLGVLLMSAATVAAAQSDPLDAVRAAADAATAAAHAAQAAAEAAKVAAEAAHISVTGTRLVATPALNTRRVEVPTLNAAQSFSPPAAQPSAQSVPQPVSVATSSPAARPRPADTSQVYTRADLDLSGHNSVAEFLRAQSINIFGSSRPGLGGDSNGSALLDLRGLGADRTLVLLDGRRVAPAVNTAGALIQNLNTLPMAAIERIEVTADGVGAKYGADAIGGVVNIITRSAFDGLSATAGLTRPELGGGEETYYSLTGGVSGARGSFGFAVENTEQDAPLDENGVLRAAGVARDTAFLTASLEPVDGLRVFAQGAYGAVATYANKPENTLSNEDFAHTVVGGQLHTKALGGVTLDASAQRGRARVDANGQTLDQSTELDALRAQLNLGGLQLPGFRLPFYVGSEHTVTRLKTDITASRTVRSTFGGASLRLLNWIDLDYRLREDLFASEDEPLVSERFGASIALLPGFRVRGSYATGYGLATFGEQFGSQGTAFNRGIDYTLCEKSGAGVVQPNEDGLPEVTIAPGTPGDSPCREQTYMSQLGGNPNIEPERSEHWRAGIDVNVPLLALSLDAYRIELTDTTQVPSAGATLAGEWLAGFSENVTRRNSNTISLLNLTARNEGSLTTQGAELDLRLGNYLDASRALGIRVLAHYIDEYLVSTVDRLPAATPATLLIPELRANIGVRFAPSTSTTLQLNANYIGESTSPDRSLLVEEWFTLDAQLALRLPWKGALTIGVRNLLDQRAPFTNGLGDGYFDSSRYTDHGIAPYVRYRQSL